MELRQRYRADQAVQNLSDLAARVGSGYRCGRAAGTLSIADAQIHLESGAKGSLD